jgi:hypothetical protein
MEAQDVHPDSHSLRIPQWQSNDLIANKVKNPFGQQLVRGV